MLRCFKCLADLGSECSVCPYCGFNSEHTETEFDQIPPGTILEGRYYIGNALGRGGFGITYIAWDQNLRRKVAVKEYLPRDCASRKSGTDEVTFTEKTKDLFLKGKNKVIEESQRLAGLSGIESVVTVHEQFEANGTAYIVMEYLDGETVRDRLNKTGKFSWNDTLKIITPVLSALSEVHKSGVVHRDISPDNIFLCKNGKVKIIDFGSARSADPDSHNTVMVKQGYTPYEQYSSEEKQGSWTDVYSICATMYKMLTGTTPKAGVERIIKDDIEDIANLTAIPEKAAAALMKGLAVRPEDRIQTAEELFSGINIEIDDEKPNDLPADPPVDPEDEETVLLPGNDPIPPKGTENGGSNEGGSDEGNPESNKNNKKPIIIAVLAVLAAAAVIAVCIFAVKNKKETALRDNSLSVDSTAGEKSASVEEKYGIDLTRGKCEYDENGVLLKFTDNDGTVYEFDKDGKMTKKTSVRSDGDTLSEVKYLPDGGKIERVFSGDGTYSDHEYSPDGKKTKKTFYYASGDLDYIEYYDEKGNKEKAEYFSEGKIVSCDKFYYDANGKSIKEEIFDAEGKLLWYFTFSYDENGHISNRIRYNNDNTIVKSTSYEYYEDGCTFKVTEYDENNVIKSETEYYPKGNTKKWTSYKDGKITEIMTYSIDGVTETNTKYEDDGSYVVLYFNDGKVNEYNSDGELIDYYVYDYDENDNAVKKTYYDTDDSCSFYFTYEYDENDVIRCNRYNSSDELQCHWIYEYNNKGEYVGWKLYNKRGLLVDSGTDDTR